MFTKRAVTKLSYGAELSPPICAHMSFDSRLRHNAFRQSCEHSDFAFILYLRHNGRESSVHSACDMLTDSNGFRPAMKFTDVVTTTDLMFTKCFELWCFDKLHVEMNLMWFSKVVWWILFVKYLIGTMKQRWVYYISYNCELFSYSTCVLYKVD